MKNYLKITLFVLLLCGVFGADEVKSVMEGDSVTLTPDPAKIQRFTKIKWRFGDTVIAQTKRTESSPEYKGIFRDRLKLDHQTGSLTIRNVRIKQSGLYELQIDYSDTVTSNIKFNVTVKESPSVDAVEFEIKSESVMEGDPVTLHTDVTELIGDELIVWRSGDEGKLIAKADIEAKNSSLYDETDERFRDRLKLDQTGSLIITNTRITDTGLYTAKISSKKQTSFKRFTVTVNAVPVPDSGLSGGAVAGIVIAVLLLAVAVAGVMYYCLCSITTKLPNQTWSVPAEDNITLNPETEIQRGDEIQWVFGDTLIAEIEGENREMKTYDGPDERFKNKLKQGETTGSLTVTNIFTEHTGLYTLKITRGRKTLYKRFNVSVSGTVLTHEEMMISVMEGDPVFLYPDTNIQTDDEVQWLFGDEEQTVLTEIKNTKVTKYTGPDRRFRDRLKLNEETGKLIFTNITTEHDGYYTLKITRGREKIYKRFYMIVSEREITGIEGESVILEPVYEIKKDDLIRWLFGDREQQTVIAEFNVKTGEILPYDDERFRDRLELNKTTGSLTIKNTSTKHSGVYRLEIRSSSGDTEQTITVTVRDNVEEIFLQGGDSVTLKTDTEIKRADLILWMFGDLDKHIAQIRGRTVEIYDDYVNERFRGRLKLDKTGSLTITKIEAEHMGLYKVLIISSSRGTLYKRFKVSVPLSYVAVTVGEPVHLNTGLTEIQRDEEVEWRFGNTLIAEIKGGTVETHDVPDKRFRDRLMLNMKTGDLIIKNSTDKHTGEYKLKIRSSKGNTNRTYTVNITVRNVTVTAGDSVHLNTGLTEIQRDDKIEWMFGKENSLIAEIKGGTGETHDVPDKRFRNRLEPNETTGDLIIKNSTDEHAGPYTLKIRSSKGNTYWTYFVNIRDAAVTNEARTESSMKEKTDSRRNRVNDSATVEIPLLDGEDVNVVNEEERTSLL